MSRVSAAEVRALKSWDPAGPLQDAVSDGFTKRRGAAPVPGYSSASQERCTQSGVVRGTPAISCKARDGMIALR